MGEEEPDSAVVEQAMGLDLGLLGGLERLRSGGERPKWKAEAEAAVGAGKGAMARVDG